jgi:hypothetical protein
LLQNVNCPCSACKWRRTNKWQQRGKKVTWNEGAWLLSLVACGGGSGDGEPRWFFFLRGVCAMCSYCADQSFLPSFFPFLSFRSLFLTFLFLFSFLLLPSLFCLLCSIPFLCFFLFFPLLLLVAAAVDDAAGDGRRPL